MELSPFDRGLIAGLIACQGSWAGDGRTSWLNVRLGEDDLPLLETLLRLLGGALYGPYASGGRRFYDWRLRGPHLAETIPLFDALLPPGRKRAQYETWKRRYGYPTGEDRSTAETQRTAENRRDSE